MSRLRIGDHEVSVSEDLSEQITLEQARNASQFVASLGLGLENLIAELEKRRNAATESGHGIRDAVVRVVNQFQYVDSGVRAIAALNYVSVPKSVEVEARNAQS